jgi:large subunit ribosomal protein L13
MSVTATKKSQIQRKWHLVDLQGQILGRVSTQIAQLLLGKNKPYFVRHLDCGDYVIAINAKDIKVTGRKAKQKMYYHHTGYPKGFRETTFAQLFKKDPRQIIIHAVKGMLPQNKLKKNILGRLKVFIDANHPYQDKLNPQKPNKNAKKS